MTDEVREFKLPDLGEGLEEAEIVSWMVKEGDEVTLNQPIVEVETEKAIVEIPSPFAGTVEKLFGDVGQRMKVGAPLVSIRTAGGDAGAAPASGGGGGAGRRQEVLVGYGPEEGKGKRRRRKIGRRDDEGAGGQVEEEAPAATVSPLRPARKALATPPVRKLARERGIDIDTVTGTGPGGRVTREDVMAAAADTRGEARAAEPAPVRRISGTAASIAEEEEHVPVRAIRRSIARQMVRSYHELVHVTEWCTIDATELMQLRERLNASPEAQGQKLSPLPIVVKALVPAIRQWPHVNSSWAGDDDNAEIIVKKYIHVGIATDTDRGLLVPVVKNADHLNVFEIAQEIGRLVGISRDGSIGVEDLKGSTITITNVGSFGMESGTPIINYPETGIIALGAITKKPWVVNDEIVPRHVMTLAFTFDHRVLDGAYAGRFLRYLGDLIENPARLFGVL